MQKLDMDTLLFFDAHRAALPLFAALEEMIFECFPEAKKECRKRRSFTTADMSLPASPSRG